MSIIQDFIALTDGTDVPVIFRKWIGLVMVASALGRDVRGITNVAKGPFYPNFFVVLVGEPGVGKTIALRRAQKIMRALGTVNMGPNQITPQKLLSKLADMSGQPESDDRDTEPTTAAEMALFLDEFGSLVKKDDPDFMEMLAELWNNPDIYEYDTHKRGDEILRNVNLNLVAGTQPSWFTVGFNSTVMEQGFPARLILIYSDERLRGDDPFAIDRVQQKRIEQGTKAILEKLEKVARLAGQFAWTPDAMTRFKALNAADFAPAPTEPLLRHYTTRRHFHLAKLAMVVAASNHQRTVVRLEDLDEAWEMLLEAEREMPRALISAGGNRYRRDEEYAADFIAREYAKRKTAVPEGLIRRRLSTNLTAQECDIVIEALIGQRRIKARGGDKPFRGLIPI